MADDEKKAPLPAPPAPLPDTSRTLEKRIDALETMLKESRSSADEVILLEKLDLLQKRLDEMKKPADPKPAPLPVASDSPPVRKMRLLDYLGF